MTGRRPRSSSLAAVAVLMGIGAPGCSGPAEPAGREYLSPKPASVTVTMSDYRIVVARRLPPGRVVFAVTNTGDVPHQLSLFPLAADDPPVDEVFRQPVPPQMVPLQQMPTLTPGQASSFAVDLDPRARYAVVSLWPSPQGVPDVALGMSAELRTSRPAERDGGAGPP